MSAEQVPTLNEFLNAVAARRPTPGGGSVAAAAGAMACAMGRMVAAYSPTKGADAETQHMVATLGQQLQRADGLLRRLIVEDAAAYSALNEAAKRLRADPSTKHEHDDALAVAISVPLEIAAVACESIVIMERLVAVANRHLLSDLGIAAVLAETTARAAAFMVRVNTKSLGQPETRRQAEQQIDRSVERARETLARIDAALRKLSV